VKTNTYVQFYGNEVLAADLEKRIKKIWREKGHAVKEMVSIDMYIKVEENTCYYVINGSFTGAIPIAG